MVLTRRMRFLLRGAFVPLLAVVVSWAMSSGEASALVVGDFVKVQNANNAGGLAVRKDFGSSGQLLCRIKDGHVAKIIAGPKTANSMTWWQHDQGGWSAEKQGTTTYLVKASAPSTGQYNRTSARAYAWQWALGRNPAYADFSKEGGDCTNFASQVLYEGGKIPEDKTGGITWYYDGPQIGPPGSGRTATWNGSTKLREYIKENTRLSGPNGPQGSEVARTSDLLVGDLVFLHQRTPEHGDTYHTMIVMSNDGTTVKVAYHNSAGNPDQRERTLSEISYVTRWLVRITGYIK